MKEYIWTVNAVIELPEGVDSQEFFDGLWDAILDHVDINEGHLGGTYRVQEYEEGEEADDG
ncbi:MAG: hypothetical protein ACOC8X_11705 [Chloroflexota bacterium]